MAYRDNVQALCDTLGIPNPVREEDLSIQSVLFHGVMGFPNGFRVDATEMNRAGRLYLEQMMRGHAPNHLPRLNHSTLVWKERYAEFFTLNLWNDCGPERRTLVYGMKLCRYATVTYKPEKEP
jgi:hypothetical protein